MSDTQHQHDGRIAAHPPLDCAEISRHAGIHITRFSIIFIV